MPTYEYECQSCKQKLEVFQSMTAKHLKKCDKCGGALRRLIGAGAGIIFKGSGFYATDYRSSEYKEKAKKEKLKGKPACPKESTCPLNCSNKSDKKS